MTFAQVASEKRSFERIPAERAVKVCRVPQYTTNLTSYSYTRDISAGGLRITSTSFLGVGDRIMVDIENSESPTDIRAIGQVTHAEWEPQVQMWQLGIKFAEIDAEARDELYRLLERL